MIRKLITSIFTSSEVQSIAEKTLKAVNHLAETQPTVAAFIVTLTDALKKLKKARIQAQKNTHTELLVLADEARDMAFRAFVTLVEAGTLRQNAEHAAQANTLQRHIEKFDLRIPYLGYSEETNELNLFLAEMDKVAAYIEFIGGTAWLEELKAAQEHFVEVQEGKIDEELEKTVLIPTKEAKELTLTQLTVLINILNGLQMAGTADFIKVNKKVDQIIAEAERIARARQTRNKNTSTENKETE